jgi:hypothetical protein
VFRWRHVQSLVRLTQIVHILSDVITDWEVIVDSFEQIIVLLLTASASAAAGGSSSGTSAVGSSGASTTASGISASSTAATSLVSPGIPPNPPQGGLPTVIIHEELTPMDIERIFECIERFKGYSVFLSDESLMRLMTSLVALSLNPLAASVASSAPALLPASPPNNASVGMSTPLSKHRHGLSASSPNTPSQSTPSGGGGPSQLQSGVLDIPAHALDGPAYLLEALSSRALNYSLYAAVEVAKKNAFRISCVWQMVTSHLRMMSSHKVFVPLSSCAFLLTLLTDLASPSLFLLSLFPFLCHRFSESVVSRWQQLMTSS